MVVRASFDSGCQLPWLGILSAASVLMVLALSPSVKASEGIFKCDFESDLCGIQQSGNDWVRKSGATSSMDAGPEGGHDQSKFYFFPENLKKLHTSEFASPDLSSSGVVCIQFAYAINGTKNGKLIVYTQKGSQSASRKEIWQSADASVRNWILQRLPYSLESGERIIWRAISGGTGEETAVDSILITKGACNETCLGTQWKVEKDVVSPGGIYMANLNKAELCKDQCILRYNCLAVDMISEGSGVLCYLHIRTFSLREVIKVSGASQYTITSRCGTASLETTTTPAPGPTSSCLPAWTKRSYFYSPGGSLRAEVNSASACRDTCLQERACIAVDVLWSENVLVDIVVCLVHVDHAKLLAPLLMENTEQWELVDRCSVIDVEKSRGFTHKPLESKGCLGQWEERRNTHYVGGTYFTPPNNTVIMPRTCLAECLADVKCIAVDINVGRSPIECWMFSSITDRSKFYSTANIRHYFLTKRCASDKEIQIAEDDSGSGSDVGEGSGAPPETPKPKAVCKALNWERQPFYSPGGAVSKGKTLEQCLDGCVNDAKCQGFDYHEQKGCVVHQEAADFYYALSGQGWIQYQLISDCAKIPAKELPGKANIRPECTKGVIRKEYMRSPGAVFHTKVSSTWQCLDSCVHNRKCMAAEIHKVDRGLGCYYHYKNISFDVLLSSSDVVLYVLNKPCIRLRDSDLMPTTAKASFTPIPIVDLDKDDTIIEAEATFCEDAMCYMIMKAKLKWKEAQTECEMKHGKLLSIKNIKIQNTIEKFLKIHKITDEMWIGATLINEIAFTNQSVSLWRVVQGTGVCETKNNLGNELLDRAVISQGCFLEAKDAKEKEFLYVADVPPHRLIPATCLEECRKQNFSYAGLRDGSVCSCGISFGMYGPTHDCAESCMGDYSQHCGGVGAHSVFKAAAISEDFSMWHYNEPRNMSNGHWCGAIDMFELDAKKRLASRLCNEDQKFLCQIKPKESPVTGASLITGAWSKNNTDRPKWFGSRSNTESQAKRYHSGFESGTCPTGPGYKTTSLGICVYFGKDEVTWHQARTHCLSLNGDLLIVDSEAKREVIQAAAKAAFPMMSKRYIWIGLFSKIYYWDDLYGGSELCYTKFSHGQPVFQMNCLYLDPKKNFEWFSGSCEDESREFICEIDTSKGELPPRPAPRPPKQQPAKIAQEHMKVEPPGEKRVAASTDLKSGGGNYLSALEIALVAGIGIVAVALLIGGTMYGISKQRNRATDQNQGDVELRQQPHDKGPAEPAQPESKAASGQASSLSQHQGETHSGGSPSARQSRESPSGFRRDVMAGSGGLDSASGGAPLSTSASSAGGGSTQGE